MRRGPLRNVRVVPQLFKGRNTKVNEPGEKRNGKGRNAHRHVLATAHRSDRARRHGSGPTTPERRLRPISNRVPLAPLLVMVNDLLSRDHPGAQYYAAASTA